jgi:hypothetical protein
MSYLQVPSIPKNVESKRSQIASNDFGNYKLPALSQKSTVYFQVTRSEVYFNYVNLFEMLKWERDDDPDAQNAKFDNDCMYII